MKILKIVLDIDADESNEEEKFSVVNSNTKDNFIHTKFLSVALLFEELIENINIFIDAINDGRYGIINHI